jgi:hypothetical protein
MSTHGKTQWPIIIERSNRILTGRARISALGEVALRREKLDAAEQEYRHELEANPGSAAALARLAR